MKFSIFLSLFLILWMPLALQAERYRLFQRFEGDKKSIPHPFYEEIVEHLKIGDQLVFSDGREFEVLAILGNGNTNKIISIGKGLALRIPYPPPGGRVLSTCRRFLNDFIEGYKEIVGHGAPIPKVYLDQALKGEYVVVEEIKDIYFDFYDLEILSERFRPYEKQRKKILRDLKTFIREIRYYKYIGDFHSKQIVYTKKGWMLLDWGKDTSLKSDMDWRNRIRFFSHEELWGDHSQDLLKKLRSLERAYALKEQMAKKGTVPMAEFFMKAQSVHDYQYAMSMIKQGPFANEMFPLFKQLLPINSDEKLWFPFIELFLADPRFAWNDLVEDLAALGNDNIDHALVHYFFHQKHSASMGHLLDLFIQRGNPGVLTKIASRVFSEPHALIWERRLLSFIKDYGASYSGALVLNVFVHPFSQSLSEHLSALVNIALVKSERKRVDTLFVYNVLPMPHAEQWESQALTVMRRADDELKREFVEFVLRREHTKNWETLISEFQELTNGAYTVELNQSAFAKAHPEKWTAIKGAPLSIPVIGDPCDTGVSLKAFYLNL